VERTVRDGHRERWWALEVRAGPYGPDRRQRAIVATTDPTTVPELTTWYLVTNLPAPSSTSPTTTLAPADLTAVVRLYGLRNWVEQSDKQVKGTLGWSAYQGRKDEAIRRHWALVCCAFSCYWWADGHDRLAAVPPLAGAVARPSAPAASTSAHAEMPMVLGGKSVGRATAPVLGPPADRLAGGPAAGPGLVRAVDHARTVLARLDGPATAPTAASPARLGRGRPSHSAL
jgi:hypothetical protein